VSHVAPDPGRSFVQSRSTDMPLVVRRAGEKRPGLEVGYLESA
jgi:hypothetical protein